MPKGILGGPRPFVSTHVVIDPETLEGRIERRGPFGVRRVFAMPNPEVPDQRVDECISSRAGINFAVNWFNQQHPENLQIEDPRELPRKVPEDSPLKFSRNELIGIAEDWCRGMLESTSFETTDQDAPEGVEAFKRTAERRLGLDEGALEGRSREEIEPLFAMSEEEIIREFGGSVTPKTGTIATESRELSEFTDGETVPNGGAEETDVEDLSPEERVRRGLTGDLTEEEIEELLGGDGN
jgi:hypothetical protein